MKVIGETQYISISEAKTRLPQLVKMLEPTVLLRHNEPVAAVLSIEKYNDYLALERLMRHPALFARLRAKAEKASNTPVENLRTMEDLERINEHIEDPELKQIFEEV